MTASSRRGGAVRSPSARWPVASLRGETYLEDDTLVLVAGDGEERWPCPPALSSDSRHPEWFTAVTDEFVSQVLASRVRGAAPPRANLAEAAVRVALKRAARESSRRGGEEIARPAPLGARPMRVGSAE
jgi:hypothetical protein